MTCPNCKEICDTKADKCASCGYPFSGTEAEKSTFIGDQVLKVGRLEVDAKDTLRNAKLTLFIIGGMNIILSFVMITSPITLIISVIIGLAFIVFGFFVEEEPLLFLVIALVLLLLLYVGDAVFDPAMFMKGILWKILYVTTLIYGIIRIRLADKIRKESDYLSQK